MDKAYEKQVALVRRATIELKAVVLPRLMSDRTTTMEREKRMALMGMGVPIVIILRIILARASPAGAVAFSYLLKPAREWQTACLRWSV